MSYMTMLNLAMLAILGLWALDTLVIQPLRFRQLQAAAQQDSAAIAAAQTAFIDSALSRSLSLLAGLGAIAYLAAVIIFRVDVDFSLVLVLASLGSGFVWLLEVAYLRRLRLIALQRFQAVLEARGVASKADDKQPLLVEYSVSFFPVLAAVLVVRSFLAEPYTIPSGSMLPTLEIGDYILVNKFAYGLRLPVAGNRFVNIGEPQRGDVVVFRFPENPSENFIKRLVGLPGDHIRVDGPNLYVNNQLVSNSVTHVDTDSESWQQYFTETLGQHVHLKRQLVGADSNRLEMKYTDVVVPQGHYFMMGDNRDESNDSRFWGFVPDRNIVGKAFLVWIHKDPGLHLPTFGRDGIVR